MVKKGLAMSGKLGSEPLGKFYTGKKPKKRREWRGFKDTWYDYVRWLGYWRNYCHLPYQSVQLYSHSVTD